MKTEEHINKNTFASLKNRALIIVCLMIAILSAIFLYIIINATNKEIRYDIAIYDTLVKNLYQATRSHVNLFYRNYRDSILALDGARSALEKADRQNLQRLVATFTKALCSQTRFLQTIDWHPRAPGKTLRLYDRHPKTSPTPTPSSLVAQIIENNNEKYYFMAGETGLTYRIIFPATLHPDHPGPDGALEFSIAPQILMESFTSFLSLHMYILSTSPLPMAEKVEINRQNYYYTPDKCAPGFSLTEILNRHENIFPASTVREVTHNNKHYILHQTLDFFDYNGNPVGKAISVQEISRVKQNIQSTIVKILIITIFVLAAIFLILYYTFNRLTGKLVTRETQLQTANSSLEKEIRERQEIEKELKTHRDHLEDLIVEGTRELEIKSQEIEANEERLRTITSAIKDAIVMVNPEGGTSFWNPSAERIFGYSYAEAQDKDFFEHIAPLGGYRAFSRTVVEEPPTDSNETNAKIIEIECTRKDGGIFPAELVVSAVDIQGLHHMLVLVRDITRKREHETEKRTLSRAVEQSSVAVEIADTRGVITYVNPRFCEITGYTREEVLGKKTNILKSNFNPIEDYRHLWSTITAGKDWHGELYNRKKNGDLYWDSTLISPIKDAQGIITHYVAIKDDVTERKNMEIELLSAKESAEAANRSKGEFLANMSHEIRTPMNAIIGMTELTLGTTLSNEQREYLELVRHASRSLLNLLNDILDFSRVEAGKLLLEPAPFSLRKTVGETAKSLGLQAHEKKLEMVYHIDSEVPDRLIGDPGRLRQVIINLIGNAIKFTERGEIVLKIEIMEEGLGEKILLHFLVSDTGIGVPEDQRSTIFEQFSQVDASVTRKYGGTGLGLAISSRLVELMGGIIWVESPSTFPHSDKGGPGSTFHFTALFEANATVGAPGSPSPSRLAQLKELNTLIVDDSLTNRRYLEDVLATYGAKTKTVASGQEALQILENIPRSQPNHLVILDHRMPDMDGGTVLEKIREELGLSTPVILLTSGSSADDLHEFKKKGASATLLKPIVPQELIETILGVIAPSSGQPGDTPTHDENRNEEKGHIPIRILVAEDNLVNQRLIRRLLEKVGHMVQIAGNGKEAVEIFEKTAVAPEEKFQLVLMDIQMPTMDGIEATRRLKKIDKEIPIIALTAHAMKGDKGKFLSEGMDDYISKPIDKTLLFQTINKYIKQ